jgi:hypothetical protein
MIESNVVFVPYNILARRRGWIRLRLNYHYCECIDIQFSIVSSCIRCRQALEHFGNSNRHVQQNNVKLSAFMSHQPRKLPKISRSNLRIHLQTSTEIRYKTISQNIASTHKYNILYTFVISALKYEFILATGW